MKKTSRILVSMLCILLICLAGTCFAVWNESKSGFEYTNKYYGYFTGYTTLQSGGSAFDQWSCIVGNGSGHPFFHWWSTSTQANISTTETSGVLDAHCTIQYTLSYKDSGDVQRGSYLKIVYDWIDFATGSVTPTETISVYLNTQGTGGDQLLYQHSEYQEWNSAQNCFLPRHMVDFNVVQTCLPDGEVYVSVDVARTYNNVNWNLIYDSGEQPASLYPMLDHSQVNLSMRVDFLNGGGGMWYHGYFGDFMDVYIIGDVSLDDVTNMKDIAEIVRFFNIRFTGGNPGAFNWFLWAYRFDDQCVDGVINMKDTAIPVAHFNDHWYE